jgi:DMSO/TMAO reductase YedYZ molybdopterin-dependent catalytic subunit
MPEAFNAKTWTLMVNGEVTTPLRLSYSEFQALPTTTQVSDFHCE